MVHTPDDFDVPMAMENDEESIVACYSSGFRCFKKNNNTYKYVKGKNTDFSMFSLVDLKNKKVFITTHDQDLISMLSGCQEITLELKNGESSLK